MKFFNSIYDEYCMYILKEFKNNIKSVSIKVANNFSNFNNALSSINELTEKILYQISLLSDDNQREQFDVILSIVVDFAKLYGMQANVIISTNDYIEMKQTNLSSLFSESKVPKHVNLTESFYIQKNYLTKSIDISNDFHLLENEPYKPHIKMDENIFVVYFLLANKPVIFTFDAMDQIDNIFLKNKALRDSLANVLFSYVNTLKSESDKKRLRKTANIDALTGLRNRRSVINRIEKKIIPLVVKKGDLLLGVMDIDKFKRVNSILGHDGGDTLLISLADVIRDQFRALDVIGRIGGEEFLFSLHSEDEFDLNKIKFLVEKVENLKHIIKNKSVEFEMGLCFSENIESENSFLSIMISVLSYMNEFDHINLSTVEAIDLYNTFALYGLKVKGISDNEFKEFCFDLVSSLSLVDLSKKEWRVDLVDFSLSLLLKKGLRKKNIVLSINISVSIGLTVSDKKLIDQIMNEQKVASDAYSKIRTKMFQEADRSLQAAKDQGRDMVVMSDSLENRIKHYHIVDKINNNDFIVVDKE